MIVGIGIDSAEVKRFTEWYTKPLKHLEKVFSESEIEYCLKNKRLSAQRFAVRFAAREAFFKALCCMLSGTVIPFLTVCKAVHIAHGDNNIPVLHIDWSLLVNQKTHANTKNIVAHVSLTHTGSVASAVVILEQ